MCTLEAKGDVMMKRAEDRQRVHMMQEEEETAMYRRTSTRTVSQMLIHLQRMQESLTKKNIKTPRTLSGCQALDKNAT